MVMLPSILSPQMNLFRACKIDVMQRKSDMETTDEGAQSQPSAGAVSENVKGCF